MLTFDAENHVYHWNGQPVVNVTRVLSPLTDYSKIPPAVLANAQEEGKAIHYMVECHCKRIPLDLPPWMEGHHAAMLKFFDETGFQCWLSEHRIYHGGLRYAGTLDLYGEAPRLRGIKGNLLIDVKRSFYAGAAIGLQLAAYNEGLHAGKEWPRARHRFALQLRPNGQYRLEPFEDPDDFAVFTALLTTQRWKEKHGRP